MRVFLVIFAFLLLILFSIAGFQGGLSTRPPIEIFPDMDIQPRYRPQGESAFWADGRADREPVPGTVARGHLRDDPHRFYGRAGGDEFASGFPGIVDQEVMRRGQDRYQIYCGICHGAAGDGMGVTRNYGMAVLPSLVVERVQEMPEGEIYDVISNGRGLMMPYAERIPVDDRWAIVAYVRALQRAQAGTLNDVPEEYRGELQ